MISRRSRHGRHSTQEWPRTFPSSYEAPSLAVDRPLHHPDYRSDPSTERHLDLPLQPVQHHLGACRCLHGRATGSSRRCSGVAWDGTGYGPDGTIWGGEFLLVAAGGWHRFAKPRPFRLPGGDRAIREPRRAAVGLLYEAYGERAFEMSDLAPISAFSQAELGVIRQMLIRGSMRRLPPVLAACSMLCRSRGPSPRHPVRGSGGDRAGRSRWRSRDRSSLPFSAARGR